MTEKKKGRKPLSPEGSTFDGFKLPINLFERVQAHASDFGVSRGDIYRQGLELFFAREDRRKRKRGDP